MIKVESQSAYYIKGRGTAIEILSPVECHRSLNGFYEAIGGELLEIDGTVHRVLGVEMNMPNSPVHIGERISVLVRDSQDRVSEGTGT